MRGPSSNALIDRAVNGAAEFERCKHLNSEESEHRDVRDDQQQTAQPAFCDNLL
jgi:hypothetical protein